MNYKCIKKPTKMSAQIDMVWDELFNHIPSRLRWQDVKLNFLLGFVALILGLLGVLIAL